MEERPKASSPFEKLPNELVHEIYDLCPFNTKLCLKMCCTTFRDGIPGTVRELYEDLNRTLDFGNARFERLCLDDTYICSKTGRHVCSVCQCVHRAGEFTEQELEKDPRERVCEASQGILHLTPDNHVTPGVSFTYQQLLLLRNASLPLSSLYDENFNFRLVEEKSGQWVVVMDWNFAMQYPLPPAWNNDLRQLLENFPVHACPHLTSSDPQLLQAIVSYFVSYWGGRPANPALFQCSKCNTRIEFALPATPNFSRHISATPSVVSFRVERRLGRLGESAVDPRWKAQSLQPPSRMLQM